jgi:putative beta-barrel porin BBP2
VERGVNWVVFLLLGLPALLHALPLGPFEITPELTFEQRYDSNIFLRTEGVRDDFITRGALSLKVALPFRLTGARRIIPSVSYFAEAAVFFKNSDQNFQNQGIGGGLELDFPLARPDQRLTFNASNRFRSVTELTRPAEQRDVFNASSRSSSVPELTSIAEQSDIGPRTRRNENFLTADIGYFLTRRDEIHLSYTRLDVDQKGIAEFFSHNENTIGLTYFRQVGPLFSGLIEYGYRFIDFTNLRPVDPDLSSTGHIIAIGIWRDPEARLSGMFRVGAELRNFERQAEVIRPFASAALGYRITRRLQTSLLFVRAIQESTNLDFAFFEATFARLRLTQQFTPKLSAFVEGAFELDEFQHRVSPGEPKRRLDHLYGLGVGGEYLFARWLATGLFYQFQTIDSNVMPNYVVNQVILSITLRF